MTNEGSGVTGPVPNSVAGIEFVKGLHWPETLPTISQGGLLRLETLSTTLTCSEKAEHDDVSPVSLLCRHLLQEALQVLQSTLGWVH